MRDKKLGVNFKCAIVFWAILFVLFSFSRVSSAQEVELVTKPTIFIYNEDESLLAMDIGGGIGHDNIGIRAGFAVHLDVYHIMAGFHYNVSLQGSKQQVTEKSFLLGYRYRSQYFMAALASGFSRQVYKCTSGMNYDCYNYKEETISATPLVMQADWIVSDSFAMGVSVNQLFSRRTDVTGVMFNFKFGAFRNIY
ncbi:MAG: hypothetical protein M3Q95_11150 [Bacteroidota bacterium]|nr:hypothetical protein [Bacteroidota bacterium]